MELKRDLSEYGHPITDMFPWPKHADDWEQYKLSKDQLAFFEEHGYVSGIKLLNPDIVERLRLELEEIMNPDHPNHDLLYEFHSNESEDPDRIIFHSLGHWRMTPGFHDVLWNPAFVMAAYQLLGDRTVRFWHDQLFCKPARHGGVVAWHQDYSYWTCSIPMQHLTAWVGLDDTSLENGCMQYIPGSHRWGLLNKPSLTGEMRGLAAFLDKKQSKALDNPVPIEMELGHATFHHPLLVHGSFENNSDKPRRAFVLNVFADGTKSDSDEPLLDGVPTFAKGHKLEGKFFPELYQKKSAS
jgi:ectoine hydroxylase-related dioxygenase (phytanoyl-CoA dioxygenase family)